MIQQTEALSLQKDPLADHDSELEAMRSVIAALTNLSEEARQRVIEYVFKRLALSAPDPGGFRIAGEERTDLSIPPALTSEGDTTIRDIRTLKEKKLPRSAIEMAVLVAYYLAEVAAPPHRKTEIGTDDINTYFKQAGYPIPGRPRKTLFDAKAAGYLDSPSQGSYKLNPVGHNLIAHGLPAKATGSKRAPRKKKRN